MATDARMVELTALAGDAARAAMLRALMDGRALTTTELARVAGIAPQTAGAYLAQMVAAQVLQVERQGPHRYHRLASPDVARMTEIIMQGASELRTIRSIPMTGPRDVTLRTARTCYGHLAGRLGVALADAMVRGRHVELAGDAGLVTSAGIEMFERLGIDTSKVTTKRGASPRVLCRPCLDWS